MTIALTDSTRFYSSLAGSKFAERKIEEDNAMQSGLIPFVATQSIGVLAYCFIKVRFFLYARQGAADVLQDVHTLFQFGKHCLCGFPRAQS